MIGFKLCLFAPWCLGFLTREVGVLRAHCTRSGENQGGTATHVTRTLREQQHLLRAPTSCTHCLPFPIIRCIT